MSQFGSEKVKSLSWDKHRPHNHRSEYLCHISTPDTCYVLLLCMILYTTYILWEVDLFFWFNFIQVPGKLSSCFWYGSGWQKQFEKEEMYWLHCKKHRHGKGPWHVSKLLRRRWLLVGMFNCGLDWYMNRYLQRDTHAIYKLINYQTLLNENWEIHLSTYVKGYFSWQSRIKVPWH